MITNQNKEEIIKLAGSVADDVAKSMIYRKKGITAGVWQGDNMTDVIWIGKGPFGWFLFVSPCLRHGRAESFITSDGSMEFTLHMIDRYYTRTNGKEKSNVNVFGKLSERDSLLVEKVAYFFSNEKILGQVAVTKERGAVLRTTHGLILCSEKELHDGVLLANTFVSDNELIGSQREAVKLYDDGKYEEARELYERYFV